MYFAPSVGQVLIQVMMRKSSQGVLAHLCQKKNANSSKDAAVLLSEKQRRTGNAVKTEAQERGAGTTSKRTSATGKRTGGEERKRASIINLVYKLRDF